MVVNSLRASQNGGQHVQTFFSKCLGVLSCFLKLCGRKFRPQSRKLMIVKHPNISFWKFFRIVAYSLINTLCFDAVQFRHVCIQYHLLVAQSDNFRFNRLTLEVPRFARNGAASSQKNNGRRRLERANYQSTPAAAHFVFVPPHARTIPNDASIVRNPNPTNSPPIHHSAAVGGGTSKQTVSLTAGGTSNISPKSTTTR